MTVPSTPTVGHLVRDYLPRSQTFVYTQLRFLTDFRPIVLTPHTTNPDEYPFEPIIRLTGGPRLRRVTEGIAARAGGWKTGFDRRLAGALGEHECVAMHAHFGPGGFLGMQAAERAGVPLITTFYGFDLALPEQQPVWAERYERLFDYGSLFLTEGPAMAKTLAGIGCPEDRIGLLRIGFDAGAFPFVVRPRTAPLTLVTTGRMVPKKGFDIAIRAFASARPRIGDSRLVLVGDGPEREALEALTAELGLTSHVEFAGSLSYAQYQEVMSQAHIGLQPSRTAPDGDTEGGAPTVLLEMQATGLPIVATRHADIPFVVTDAAEIAAEEDVEGVAEAIVRTAQLDEATWRERAELGRRFVEERHAGTQIAAELSDHYRNVVGTPNATRPEAIKAS